MRICNNRRTTVCAHCVYGTPLASAASVKNVTVVTGTAARDLALNGGAQQGCSVVVLRDFKEVLCSASRSQGCAGCSAVAMEAKVRQWVQRLFHDDSHDEWAEWLPRMVESSRASSSSSLRGTTAATALLRSECFSECPTESLEAAFQSWLGVSSSSSSPPSLLFGAAAGKGASSASSLGTRPHHQRPPSLANAGPASFAAAEWRTCFTQKTLAYVEKDLGSLMSQVGYSTTEDATCSSGSGSTATGQAPLLPPMPHLAADGGVGDSISPPPAAASYFTSTAPSSSSLSSSLSSTTPNAALSTATTAAARLARFRARYPALEQQVMAADGRFLKRVMPTATNKVKNKKKRAAATGGGSGGSGGGNALARCTKAGCLPDFIAIGVQKGGTTSLYHYLQQYHSGIETSKREELNFFTERYQNGVDWLRAEFPTQAPHRLRGYKSPNYFPHPLAPFRIAAMYAAAAATTTLSPAPSFLSPAPPPPSVKLVLLLREPVSRAVSGWGMGSENGREKRGLNDALGSELKAVKHCLGVEAPRRNWPRIGCVWAKFYPSWDSPGGLKVDSWKGMTEPQGSYLLPGLYCLQLRHWLRTFELKQFHVMSSKDFAKDTKNQMQKLAAFLGRAPGDNTRGATGGASGGASGVSGGVNEKVLESRHRTKKNGKSNKKSGSAVELSEATLAALRAFFEPFNEELWGLLGHRVDW